MRHEIANDTYRIYDDAGVEIFSVTLDNSRNGNQITVSTRHEVYAGPIDLIRFSGDT